MNIYPCINGKPVEGTQFEIFVINTASMLLCPYFNQIAQSLLFSFTINIIVNIKTKKTICFSI